MKEITIRGLVIQGKSEGRKLGFPTANIETNFPIDAGIYAAEVKIQNKTYKAAVFLQKESKILESHILDFSADLYGKEIEVTLKQKIRDSVPYKDDEQMERLIKKDVEKVRIILDMYISKNS